LDFLLASTQGVYIEDNTGAMTGTRWRPQGSALDHVPVSATMKLMPDYQRYSSSSAPPTQMRDYNIATLRSAYMAWQQEEEAKMQKKPDLSLISKPDLQAAHTFVRQFQEQSASLPKTYEAHNKLLLELASSHFPRAHLQPRQEWVTSGTLQLLETQTLLWHRVLQTALRTLPKGWESCFRALSKELKLHPQRAEDQAVLELAASMTRPVAKVAEIWELWKQWEACHKQVRKHIKEDKGKYLSSTVAASQRACNANLVGPIWKEIHKLTKFYNKTYVPLQDAEGKWCETAQEEMQVITNYMVDEYDVEQMSGNFAVVMSNPAHKQYNRVEVSAALHKIRAKKSLPCWSAPTALYHMTSAITSNALTHEINSLRQQSMHPNWQNNQTIWLHKPGKPPSQISNRRPINLADVGSKTYGNLLQERTSSSMEGKWPHFMYGAIPRRSTSDAIATAQSLISRLIKSRTSFTLLFVDSSKAFDRVCRSKLKHALEELLHMDPGLAAEHSNRLDQINYVTVMEDQQVILKSRHGVPQGDPCGPILFNLAYVKMTGSVQDKRKELVGKMSFVVPAQYIPGYTGARQIPMHQHIYIDDILEVHVLENPTQLPPLISPLFAEMEDWRMKVNSDKTKLCPRYMGVGSRRLQQKAMAPESEAPMGHLPRTYGEKYLGAQLDSAGSSEPQAHYRCQQAQKAFSKLRPIWKSRDFTLSQKLELYRACVESVQTYSCEHFVFTTSQLQRMETQRTRHYRHIAKSPVHLERDSNIELRERLKVPSLTSVLMCKRLMWLRRVFLSPLDHVSFITALLGHSQWSPAPSSFQDSPMLKLIAADLTHLSSRLPSQNKYHHAMDLGPAVFAWLASLTRTQVMTVHCHQSSADRSFAKRIGPVNEPRYACEICQATFDTLTKLSTHKYSSHNVRNQLRELVQGDTCPLCARKFRNYAQAAQHFQRTCGKNAHASVISSLRQMMRTQGVGHTATQPAGSRGNVVTALHVHVK
jgi:transposase-like protein